MEVKLLGRGKCRENGKEFLDNTSSIVIFFFFKFNIVVADQLAVQGPKASADTVLTQLIQNIPVSA